MNQELNPVRTVQHHLRRAGVLLAEQNFDAASREADAALAVDAASLPAQALKERIAAARAHAAIAAPHAREERFVPSGVDATSWIGFEARIQERRYRALMEAITRAIASGDGVAARAAIEEARELRPEAPELDAVSTRVAMLPVAMPETEVTSTIWPRAFGAVAMLLVGVAFLIGLEWMRPSRTQPLQARVTAPAPQPPAESPDLPVATPLSAAEDAVAVAPAPVTPAPRPAVAVEREARPIGTVGVKRVATMEESGSAVATRPTFQPATVRDDAAPDDGEIPDDYVTPQPRREGDVAAAPAPPPPAAPATAPFANAARQPTSVVTRPPAPARASTATAVVAPRADESRVAQVLNRYARAYGELDASAAHAVWPSVDERALARAFSSLASQRVSFDDCDINVSGAKANASCRGRASYVAKVGSREPRSEARTWTFELRRDGDAWMIENAEAHRGADTRNR